MEIHEAALIIPEMTEEEFQSLKASIQEYGQRETIKVYQGKILDGRHRARACEELGIEPKFEEINPDSPMQYVLDLNVERRQLTVGQKAMIALGAEAVFAEEAKAAQRERGKLTKKDKSGKIIEPAPEGAVSRIGRSRDRAAKAMNIHGDSVQKAKALAKGAPDLAEEVRQGKKDLTPAYREMKIREASARPHYAYTEVRGSDRDVWLDDAVQPPELPAKYSNTENPTLLDVFVRIVAKSRIHAKEATKQALKYKNIEAKKNDRDAIAEDLRSISRHFSEAADLVQNPIVIPDNISGLIEE